MYLTLGLVLLAFLIIGLYAGKNFKEKNANGYFMADRQLNKWFIGISAGATANSGFIVVGAVGMGYSMGLSSLLYPLAWLLGDLLFWFIFAERIRNNSRVKNAITIPDVLVGKNSKSNLKFIAGLIIFSLLMVYASAQFIASAKVLSSFNDLSFSSSLLISFIFVVSYSFLGGFKSSVWTDVAQGIMMFFLTLGMIIWGISEVGGLSSLYSGIMSQGSEYVDLLGGRSLDVLFIFIVGFAFTGFGFSISQPQVTTRIFAASSPEEVKKSKWIYIGFLHFTWMGMCLIGIIAKLLIPEISDAETALPLLATTYFPDYIVGIIFASMLATILSSLDSLLISSSSTVIMDFNLDSKVPKEKKLWVYRLSIVGIAFVALLMSFFMEATVFAAAIFAATVLSASIGSAMVLVILNLTQSTKTLTIAVLVGFITSIIWRIFEYEVYINDGFVGFIVAIILALLYERIVIKEKKGV